MNSFQTHSILWSIKNKINIIAYSQGTFRPFQTELLSIPTRMELVDIQEKILGSCSEHQLDRTCPGKNLV